MQTQWPIWQAYRRLWQYARLEDLSGPIKLPYDLPIYPITDIHKNAVTTLNNNLNEAFELSPLSLNDSLFIAYCFLFIQLVRINLPNGAYFNGTKWVNLEWYPLQAFTGKAGIAAWRKWHYDITAGGRIGNLTRQELELKFPMPEEAGLLDEAQALEHSQCLAVLRSEYKKGAVDILLEYTPQGEIKEAGKASWHPWLVLAQPEAYTLPLLRYRIQSAIQTLAADQQRWKTFVKLLPQLRPDISPRILFRAVLIGMDNCIKPLLNKEVHKLWKLRRRFLLSTPQQQALRQVRIQNNE